MQFKLLVCFDNNNGYSKNGDIPWHFSTDMKHFKKITTSTDKPNVVIMGSKTYKTLNKPLPNRINIVLSTTLTEENGIIIFNTLPKCLLYLNSIKNDIEDVFIIGGKSIYESFLDMKLINEIFTTFIEKDYECDLKFDISKYQKDFELINSVEKVRDCDKKNNNKLEYLNFDTYKYFNKEEEKFLSTLCKIVEKGSYSMDRSGVGTKSIFGKSFTYNIRNFRIPLFTHRKVFLRGIIEELLFFISGKTDTKLLENKGVNIWKGHTSAEYLKHRQLDYKEGSYGPAYGFQLRHWGAEYQGSDDHVYEGFDQLEYVIDLIKNNPTSRRILFSYWNPSVLDKVPLPSCHLLYQFNVDIEKGELSCSFYQRSNDFALACVFNIVSASVLTFMLCHLTGLKPGKVIHNIGNIHLYMNQLEVAKELALNKPYNSPLLLIVDEDDKLKKMEDFKYENFKLLFYNSHKKYNIPFNV